jgi:hypothetical protein
VATAAKAAAAGDDEPVPTADSPTPSASAALRRVDRLALLHSVFVFLLGYLAPQHDALDALFVARRHPDGRVLFDHFRGDVPLYLLRQAHGLPMARQPMGARFRHAAARLLSGQLYGPLTVSTSVSEPLYAAAWAAQQRVLARYERVREPLAPDADLISGTALCWGALLLAANADKRRVNVSPLAGIDTRPTPLHPEGLDACYSAQGNNYAFEPQREYGFYEWRVGQQYYLRPSIARDNTVATRRAVAAQFPVHRAHDASLPGELVDSPVGLLGSEWPDGVELLPEGTPVARFAERLVMACEPGRERRALFERIVADVRSGAYLAPNYDQWAGAEDERAEQDADGMGADTRDRVAQRDAQYGRLRAVRATALQTANNALTFQYTRFFAGTPAPLTAGDASGGPNDRLVPPRAPSQHAEQIFAGARAYVEAAAHGAAAYEEYVRRAGDRVQTALSDTSAAVFARLAGPDADACAMGQ